jgi:hypothetical protein
MERGERAASSAELRAIARSCGVDDDFFATAPRSRANVDVAARLRQLRGELDRRLQRSAHASADPNWIRAPRHPRRWTPSIRRSRAWTRG